jgi:hypothetical protein
MVSKRRRRFIRPPGKRRYRKIFVVAAEGIKTEPLYFNMFNDQHTVIQIKQLRGNKKSSPKQVLKRMRLYLREAQLKDKDEAWLVVDRDEWPADHLKDLYEWSETSCRYGLAVSNPKFEFWLLLHFEDGSAVNTPAQCNERLMRYLPHFEKGHVEINKLHPGIRSAIQYAKIKDTPPCRDWPRSYGTTVYRLVEKLLNANG